MCGEYNHGYNFCVITGLLEVLEKLETVDPNVPSEGLATSGTTRITGYFCSDTVLNLSNRALTDIEIKLSEKGLDITPNQEK